MMTYPHDIELQTKLGTVTLAVTEANHIFIDFSRKHHLTVNGVEVSGSLHLGRYNGRDFEPWRTDPKNPNTSHHSLSAKAGEYLLKDASDAARRKIVAVLVPAVNAWAAENAGLFIDAERAHLTDELARIDREIEELEAKRKALRDERTRINNAIWALD